jgi:hypothetical protein
MKFGLVNDRNISEDRLISTHNQVEWLKASKEEQERKMEFLIAQTSHERSKEKRKFLSWR